MDDGQQMAQVPKTVAPVAPQSTASTSRLGPGNRVASFSPAIDGLSESSGVALDAATHEHGHGGDAGFDTRTRGDGGGAQREGAFAYGRLFRADSSVFASIFEGEVGGRQSGGAAAHGATAPVAKAIGIYETNAKVIAGDHTLPGMSLSLRL